MLGSIEKNIRVAAVCKTLTALSVVLGFTVPGAALAQMKDGICGPALAVHNWGSESFRIRAAHNVKTELCDISWSSKEQVRQKALEIGGMFQRGFDALGINFGSNNNAESLMQSRKEFCEKTDSAIAESQDFKREFSDSSNGLDAWSNCIKNIYSNGSYAWALPHKVRNETIVYLINKTTVVNVLNVTQVEPNIVSCVAGETDVTKFNFQPDNKQVPTQAAMTCSSNSRNSENFALTTNWGVFSDLALPGLNCAGADEAVAALYRQIMPSSKGGLPYANVRSSSKGAWREALKEDGSISHLAKIMTENHSMFGHWISSPTFGNPEFDTNLKKDSTAANAVYYNLLQREVTKEELENFSTNVNATCPDRNVECGEKMIINLAHKLIESDEWKDIYYDNTIPNIDQNSNDRLLVCR